MYLVSSIDSCHKIEHQLMPATAWFENIRQKLTAMSTREVSFDEYYLLKEIFRVCDNCKSNIHASLQARGSSPQISVPRKFVINI